MGEVSKLIKPYLVNAERDGKKHSGLELLDENKKTVWARLPNGAPTKFHKVKHKVELVFITASGLDKGERIGYNKENGGMDERQIQEIGRAISRGDRVLAGRRNRR